LFEWALMDDPITNEVLRKRPSLPTLRAAG
jgi:hypothetical protein